MKFVRDTLDAPEPAIRHASRSWLTQAASLHVHHILDPIFRELLHEDTVRSPPPKRCYLQPFDAARVLYMFEKLAALVRSEPLLLVQQMQNTYISDHVLEMNSKQTAQQKRESTLSTAGGGGGGTVTPHQAPPQSAGGGVDDPKEGASETMQLGAYLESATPPGRRLSRGVGGVVGQSRLSTGASFPIVPLAMAHDMPVVDYLDLVAVTALRFIQGEVSADRPDDLTEGGAYPSRSLKSTTSEAFHRVLSEGDTEAALAAQRSRTKSVEIEDGLTPYRKDGRMETETEDWAALNGPVRAAATEFLKTFLSQLGDSWRAKQISCFLAEPLLEVLAKVISDGTFGLQVQLLGFLRVVLVNSHHNTSGLLSKKSRRPTIFPRAPSPSPTAPNGSALLSRTMGAVSRASSNAIKRGERERGGTGGGVLSSKRALETAWRDDPLLRRCFEKNTEEGFKLKKLSEWLKMIGLLKAQQQLLTTADGEPENFEDTPVTAVERVQTEGAAVELKKDESSRVTVEELKELQQPEREQTNDEEKQKDEARSIAILFKHSREIGGSELSNNNSDPEQDLSPAPFPSPTAPNISGLLSRTSTGDLDSAPLGHFVNFIVFAIKHAYRANPVIVLRLMTGLDGVVARLLMKYTASSASHADAEPVPTFSALTLLSLGIVGGNTKASEKERADRETVELARPFLEEIPNIILVQQTQNTYKSDHILEMNSKQTAQPLSTAGGGGGGTVTPHQAPPQSAGGEIEDPKEGTSETIQLGVYLESTTPPGRRLSRGVGGVAVL
uniref:Uncharacterized protein n=1 Tax=Chromera velia CCMP2878 TaxID=1169474 RepID=A0A0G4HTC4_9ALVE|eukprot:Cvel_8446.t1-p1 / transcript=Cvel_8446.t1 / gene=Cvel_8446 / organism=Chromera_velia_CCMP2878 / gene_product=hypothetical protein / transcript_product=hypothetical protein / location=Cvel_scaffold466:57052-64049(+) / protein_length=782 / sequence_SO=supercontig / SO=protein_coding / is_pseudo=false